MIQHWKSIHDLLKGSGLSPSKVLKELQQPLLFREVLFNKIKQAVIELKTKERIRRFVSGNILWNYNLIHLAGSKTGSNRQKLSISFSKVIELKKSKLDTY